MASQAILSLPNGAVNFATLELAKGTLLGLSPVPVVRHAKPLLDLVSSACGTLMSSAISVPQTVLLDRTMAGQYPRCLKP